MSWAVILQVKISSFCVAPQEPTPAKAWGHFLRGANLRNSGLLRAIRALNLNILTCNLIHPDTSEVP